MAKLVNFRKEEIIEYLEKYKSLILNDKYKVAIDPGRREENYKFIEDYKITTKKEKEILLSLEYTDFCYAVNNTNPGYEYEVLYVFNRPCKLYKNGENNCETIDIYIKTNIIETKQGRGYLIVISFHKRNKDIDYLFK